MNFHLDRQDGHAAITLPERFESASAAGFHAEIVAAVEQGHIRLVFDFSQVRYIDSSGLSVLLIERKMVDERGGGIIFRNLSYDVRNFFALTFLDRVFSIE